MKRWLLLLLAIIAVIVTIGGIKACQFKTMMAGFANQPEHSATVTSVKIGEADWNPTLNAVGSLRAVRGVDLAVESAGLVHAIRFGSGQDVAQGTTLVELVNDSDRARLASLETSKTLAEANFKRAEEQVAAEIVSKAELDTARAARDAAVAAVREQQAEIVKKTLRAPFSGRLGITTLSPGQYLQPGTKVVTLQQLDPIHVDFTAPQSAIAQVFVGILEEIKLQLGRHHGFKPQSAGAGDLFFQNGARADGDFLACVVVHQIGQHQGRARQPRDQA